MFLTSWTEQTINIAIDITTVIGSSYGLNNYIYSAATVECTKLRNSHFTNNKHGSCRGLWPFKEVAVGERIAYWIRTPQVPGSRPDWYGTFYWASDCWPPWQHQVERSLVCVEGRGRISWSGLTKDIKMGSCVFQCDVPHQWIAQRQVAPVSVYCDGVGCHVLCLRHGISVLWQHIGQSTTATSRHRRDMTSDV